jgi:hypothetical protein
MNASQKGRITQSSPNAVGAPGPRVRYAFTGALGLDTGPVPRLLVAFTTHV